MLLDNIMWNCLSGPHAKFAAGEGPVRRYAPGFSPIVGFEDLTATRRRAGLSRERNVDCQPSVALDTRDWSRAHRALHFALDSFTAERGPDLKSRQKWRRAAPR